MVALQIGVFLVVSIFVLVLVLLPTQKARY